MVLKQKRDNTDVLIVDASKGFEKQGKNNVLRACDIKKIVDVVTKRISVPKFSRVVSRDEIRANDYNLNIPRYVDSSDKAESWDIYSTMFGGIPESELADFEEYWKAFPTLKDTLFKPVNSGYCELQVPNLGEAIQQHPEVESYLKQYEKAFISFPEYLVKELIDNVQDIDSAREESRLSDDIFRRLSSIPLIDEYGAYQLLDAAWQPISIDLEVIQTEGFDATKQVDPNMVTKKKNNVDQEVQDGWVGHVISFDLVQHTLLTNKLDEIDQKQERLSEISGKYSELIEELSEEDREQDFVNEDSFVAAEVKKAIKNKTVEPETLKILNEADSLITEEKTIKKDIKTAEADLQLETKSTIESLTDDQVRDLLKKKWIDPLISSLLELPESVIADLTTRLEALCSKYNTTFEDVEEQISETEHTLIGLLDELTGSEFDMKGINELKSLLDGE